MRAGLFVPDARFSNIQGQPSYICMSEIRRSSRMRDSLWYTNILCPKILRNDPTAPMASLGVTQDLVNVRLDRLDAVLLLACALEGGTQAISNASHRVDTGNTRQLI